MEGAGVAQEFGAEGAHEHFLQQVEGDGGVREEAAGVGEREADVGNGEGGEVGGAEGEEFELGDDLDLKRWEWGRGTYGPAAEEDALVPGAGWGGGDGVDGAGDEAHYGVGVVVELKVGGSLLVSSGMPTTISVP